MRRVFIVPWVDSGDGSWIIARPHPPYSVGPELGVAAIAVRHYRIVFGNAVLIRIASNSAARRPVLIFLPRHDLMDAHLGITIVDSLVPPDRPPRLGASDASERLSI
jgi:hypothetical protein